MTDYEIAIAILEDVFAAGWIGATEHRQFQATRVAIVLYKAAELLERLGLALEDNQRLLLEEED